MLLSDTEPTKPPVYPLEYVDFTVPIATLFSITELFVIFAANSPTSTELLSTEYAADSSPIIVRFLIDAPSRKVPNKPLSFDL